MKKNIILISAGCIITIVLAVVYTSSNNSKPSSNQAKIPEAALPSAYFDLQGLLALSNTPEKTQQLNQFFTDNMLNNPLKTLAIIARLDSLADKQLCYDLALAIWFTNDAVALSQWLKNEPPRIALDPALNNLVFVSSSAKDNLLFADKISDAMVREQELTRLFNKWISTNTEHVIHWAIEERPDSNTWITLAFKLLSMESHTKAISSLSFLNADNLVQVRTALQTIIDNYTFGTINQDALLALQTLEPYAIREEAIAALLPLLVNEKHLSIASITAVLESLNAGELKEKLQELLALNWTNKSPEEAGLFAQSLTGDARARALSAVAESWAKQDLAAADEWLKTVDGDLDLASSSIAREAAKLGNIQISDEWLDDIIEEDIRDAAIEEAIQTYYKESPASGIYHLVYQKNLTVQKKLKLLHEIYPNEHFLTPNQALDEIGRLEGLTSGF